MWKKGWGAAPESYNGRKILLFRHCVGENDRGRVLLSKASKYRYFFSNAFKTTQYPHSIVKTTLKYWSYKRSPLRFPIQSCTDIKVHTNVVCVQYSSDLFFFLFLLWYGKRYWALIFLMLVSKLKILVLWQC